MSRNLFGPGTIVLGGGAVLLTAVLLVGFFLPTQWSVTVELRVDATAEAVMPFLDSPEGWAEWTVWPDSGLTRTGPERGAGAKIAWDDPELGAGSFSISAASAHTVRYAVLVDGAANTLMTTNGTLELEPLGSATMIHWTESGDLGRNPLMGFWGLTMEAAQTRELHKSLEQLGELLSSGSAPSR